MVCVVVPVSFAHGDDGSGGGSGGEHFRRSREGSATLTRKNRSPIPWHGLAQTARPVSGCQLPYISILPLLSHLFYLLLYRRFPQACVVTIPRSVQTVESSSPGGFSFSLPLPLSLILYSLSLFARSICNPYARDVLLSTCPTGKSFTKPGHLTPIAVPPTPFSTSTLTASSSPFITTTTLRLTVTN